MADLKAGTGLKIVKEIIEVFEQQGLIQADGSFQHVKPQQAAALINAIEDVFKAHGAPPPPWLDQLTNSLPLIFQIFGLK